MTNFSWDAVYNRRRKFADEMTLKLKLDISLQLRGGIKETFQDVISHHHENIIDQMIADKPMWEIPFYMIAYQMKKETNSNIIDHAWWLRANKSGRNNIAEKLEPWGFVTEPYISDNDIQIIRQLDFECWGVEIEVLPKDKSTWLPNGSTPIVVNIISGCLREFLKNGVGSALSIM